MELSFPQRVAVAFIGLASGGLLWSPAVAATPEVTDRQEVSSPAAGIGTGKHLTDGITLRLASEIGAPLSDESRPAEKKRGATRQNGELLILMLHILRGAK